MKPSAIGGVFVRAHFNRLCALQHSALRFHKPAPLRTAHYPMPRTSVPTAEFAKCNTSSLNAGFVLINERKNPNVNAVSHPYLSSIGSASSGIPLNSVSKRPWSITRFCGHNRRA